MKYRLTLVAASLAVLMAGCAVGPDYKRPAEPLPDQYDAVTANSTGAAQVAPDWWRAFNDPQLDALVQKALTDSSDVRIAIARIEQADAVLKQAGAALFPEVDLAAAAARSQTSEYLTTPGADRQGNNFQLRGLVAAYELDFWGKFRRAREAAIAQAAGSHYYRDTVRLTVASQVASTYIQLRATEGLLDANRESLKNREEAVAITQRRYDAGSVSRLDVEQAISNRAALVAQTSALEGQREVFMHTLALLTGDPALVIQPGASARDLPTPAVPPVGLPSELIEARPDVRQAEATLASYNAQIGVAKAALFPTISLTGAFGGASADLSVLFKSGAQAWNIGATLNLPIFDAGYRSGKVDQATAVQKEALEQYRKTVQTAFKEVRDALSTLRQATVSEEARRVQLDSAIRSEQIASARYKAGSAAFLDLLDSQRSRNDADITYLTARQNRLTAQIDLYKALGGGWRPDVTITGHAP
ncbi:efflux transporter outer membrane subunit [Uliginosibacterium sp. sgz301328]|uniref:efflux transporter outer membrane subunit n=1 Tax=Uliginosibacterium sp. sgz301328 TaxID=3243764 RepID=UPI00359D32CA